MTDPVIKAGQPTHVGAAVLLAVARRAQEKADPSADNALVAVLFSAIAFEAWLNEALHFVRVARPQDLVSPLDRLQPLVSAARLEERSTSVATRLDVIGTVLGPTGWSRGHQPFQDLALLIDIRNNLVHQRPEMTPIDVYEDDKGTFHFVQNQLANIAEQLVARKIVSRPSPSEITPLLWILHRQEVGRWAYRTSCAAIAAVIQLAPRGWPESVTFGVSDLLADELPNKALQQTPQTR